MRVWELREAIGEDAGINQHMAVATKGHYGEIIPYDISDFRIEKTMDGEEMLIIAQKERGPIPA